jgi:hypothetical protein
MPLGDPERLVRYVRLIRRSVAAHERPASDASDPQPDPLQALEVRVAHLEQQLEALQDSVYREAERQVRMITELQGQVEPSAMRAALAKDARHRGL